MRIKYVLSTFKNFIKAFSHEIKHDREVIYFKSVNMVMPSIAKIKQYEELSPGSASKIIDMWELEQSQRHFLEQKIASASIISRYLSLFLIYLNFPILLLTLNFVNIDLNV